MTKTHGLWHIAEYPIEQAVRNQYPRILNGYKVRNRTKRNRVFRSHHCQCACCGLEATHAFLDTDRLESGIAVFNLYGERDGLVMMTLDHIVPKSLGGSNSRDNLQLLCERCNHRKDSKILKIRELRCLIS